MFTLYQKGQLTYPNEVNSTPISDMSRDHNQGTVRRPQDLVLGKKNSYFSRYPSETYCLSIICSLYAPNQVLNTPLTRKCIFSSCVVFSPSNLERLPSFSWLSSHQCSPNHVPIIHFAPVRRFFDISRKINQPTRSLIALQLYDCSIPPW